MTRRSFIARHPLASVLLAIAAILLIVGWMYRIHLAAFPSIVSSYTAKEYCSCRYVMNNPAEYCLNYVKLSIPIDKITDDPANKQVSATGFWNTQHAAWLGPREGCRLQP